MLLEQEPSGLEFKHSDAEKLKNFPFEWALPEEMAIHHNWNRHLNCRFTGENRSEAPLTTAQAKDLGAAVNGEVRFDTDSRALKAIGASNYRQVPIGVVLPRTLEDVEKTLAFCQRHQVPIVSRGGGTTLAGQTCNPAVVIDFSEYRHH